MLCVHSIALHAFQCSSASRKFLNASIRKHRCRNDAFQCSSASRKFLNAYASIDASIDAGFQCSSASRKFLNFNVRCSSCSIPFVSVLFSEPKIPQLRTARHSRTEVRSFSALQRAENSSIKFVPGDAELHTPFQCSSASRKFLNVTIPTARLMNSSCFSALQRAENSSILRPAAWKNIEVGFSALQRAENSSIYFRERDGRTAESVSVLFSEPKIPQFTTNFAAASPKPVSVLFSEPKIPQSIPEPSLRLREFRFSALQRAENSSILPLRGGIPPRIGVSVLFSEPKIPQ